MSTETSIGPDDDRGGNENHGNADGCGNKTLGDKVQQAREPAAWAEILDDAGAQVPAGVPGARAPARNREGTGVLSRRTQRRGQPPGAGGRARQPARGHGPLKTDRCRQDRCARNDPAL
jgi:hypothetical protein